MTEYVNSVTQYAEPSDCQKIEVSRWLNAKALTKSIVVNVSS